MMVMMVVMVVASQEGNSEATGTALDVSSVPTDVPYDMCNIFGGIDRVDDFAENARVGRVILILVRHEHARGSSTQTAVLSIVALVIGIHFKSTARIEAVSSGSRGRRLPVHIRIFVLLVE